MGALKSRLHLKKKGDRAQPTDDEPPVSQDRILSREEVNQMANKNTERVRKIDVKPSDHETDVVHTAASTTLTRGHN